MLASLIVIFFAIGLHEYSHAKFADLAGDPTPRYYGRVTLNLFKHFDPLGTIMIVITSITGYGIGWGKPVMVDPRKMRNPRWDHFISVAAGPLSNIAQAVVWAIVFRVIIHPGGSLPSMFVLYLVTMGVIINLSLCFFNLIPLGPLDGHWLVGAFLPDDLRARWYLFNRQVGTIFLFGIIILGQLGGGGSIIGKIIGPPVGYMFRLLTGVPIPL